MKLEKSLLPGTTRSVWVSGKTVLMSRALLVCLAVAGVAAGEAPGPLVTLTLPDYERLKMATEVPAIATVESVRFRGSLKDNTLKLEVTGRRVGSFAKIPFLKTPDGIGISSCTGDAFLSSEKEGLQLVPTGDPFSLSCRLTIREKSRVELVLLAPALGIGSDVVDAEFLRRDTEGGGTVMVLTAHDSSSRGRSRGATGSARYKLVVSPSQITFEYLLSIDNPNRAKLDYLVPLPNGEAVQTVTAPGGHAEAAGLLNVELMPGTNPIRITGTLPQSQFKPLLTSDEQYLVLENHPMLSLSVETKARRISPKETGLAPGSRGSRGFLLASGDSLTWTAQKMQIFSSVGYSIPGLRYTIFYPSIGHPIVEAHLTVENQGSPQLALEVPGRPSYLDVDGEPQLLYKDRDSRLTVPLASGAQTVTLQWESGPSVGLLGKGESVPLLQFPAPVTATSVAVRTHPKWRTIGATFSRYVFAPVSSSGVLFRLAVCFGCAAVLARIGVGKGKAIFLGAGLMLLSLVSSFSLVLPIAFLLWYLSCRLGDRFRTAQKIVAGLLCLFVAASLGVWWIGSLEVGSRAPEDLLSGSQSGGSASNVPGAKLTAGTGISEGFPARIALPGRSEGDIRFSESMVPAGKSHSVRCLLIPAFAEQALGWGLAGILLVWIWRRRAELWHLMQEVRPKVAIEAA
jgi:hypothetical protein